MKTTFLLATGLAAFAMLVASPAQAQTELLVNGGFETGDLSGWNPIFPQGLGTASTTNVNPAPSSTWSANLDTGLGTGGGIDVLLKNENRGIGVVSAFDVVTVSFDLRGTITGAGPVGFVELFSELDGGGVSKSDLLFGGPIFPNADPDTWTNFSTTSVLGNDVAGGVTLQLKAGIGGTAGTQANLFFDNVSVTVPGTAIPEPTSAALLGLSGVGMLLRRRRKLA